MTKNLLMNNATTNNAITSEVNKIFSWSKKQWEADKIVFLMMYRKIFSQNMPWYSKYYRNLVICVILWGFLQFFCLVRMGSFIGFSKNYNQMIYIYLIYIYIFLNLPDDSKFWRNLVILIIIFHSFIYLLDKYGV